MKIKIIPAIIAFAFSVLFAYGIIAWGNNTDLKLFISIFGGLSLFLTLGTVLGVSLRDKRKSINVKTVSAVFTGIVIIANLLFCKKANCSMSIIIIVNSLVVLLWALLVYYITKAKNS